MLVAAAGLAAGAPLSAQETIASDRPGIGSGAYVLGRGTVQLETGIEHRRWTLGAFALDPAARTRSFGQALLRIGAGSFEVDVFANSWVSIRHDGQNAVLDAEGFEDVGFGVKLPVESSDLGIASAQLIVTAPTGANGVSGEDWLATGVFLTDATLSDQVGLSINLLLERTIPVESDADKWRAAITATPSVALGGGLGAYGGWVSSFGEGDRHVVEGGLTFLVGPDVQLDVNGGRDVNQDGWFLGAGLAARVGAR